MAGGDDLEDDFIPDDNIMLASEDEELSGDEHENQAEDVSEDATTATKDTQAASKKRKRREKEKEKRAKKRKLVAQRDEGVESSVACLPPGDIARYLSLVQVKAYPKLSVLELEDLAIPVNCIVDTTSYTGSRMLDNIGDFINHSIPRLMLRLSQKPRNNGAPTLIFVAGAALRVADVTRVLKRFRGDKGGDVAKLFAKHFKLQDHIAYLKRTKIGVAVGTPGRLGQLLEADALSLTALTHIFVDTTYRDAKKRTMIDIPETREELFRGVLGRDNIREALNSTKTQLVLF
ncbi:U3-containing 90S pre-ribosomal complex subunit-domain containing protein [Hysterangium stoloniferum]|nr:U3-containing 90S pre-ribosomal complex subunit-domain containing protein [Hysterangium stoloniferum]